MTTRECHTARVTAHAQALEARAYFAISFNDPATYPIAGDALTQPAVADFNGDGFLDVATVSARAGDNSISLLLNNGDGTFAAARTLDTGSRPFQVIAADFNRDGDMDLADTDVGDGTVSVFLGKGDGTFQQRSLTPVGSPAAAGSIPTEYLAAGDLNNDLRPDLVVNNQSDNQIVTLIGNGFGAFSKRDDVTFTSTSAGGIALADFTGDGNDDIATTLGNNFALQVYFTDGNGNLDGGHAFTVEGLTGNFTAQGLITGDFNGDTRPDVAMLSIPQGTAGRSTLSVFPGTGSASKAFSSNRNSQLTIAGANLAAADIDGDGRLDAVVSGGLQGFQVLRGVGNGSFAFPAAVDNSGFAVDGAAAVGDFNNDAKPDLAFTHETSNNDTLAVFLARSMGGTQGPTTVTPTLQATLPPAVVAGGKVSGAKVAVLITNSGTGTFNAPVTIDLFASTDTTLDEASDAVVGKPVTKKLKIGPGASKTVKLNFTAAPNVAEGDYFLIARTKATGSTGSEDASDGTVNIAAPFIDLTGGFGSTLPTTLAQGKKATVPVTVSDAGNVNASGTITLALAARPSGVVGPASDIAIPTTPVKVNLKPGASKTFKLKISTPSTLPAGSMFNFAAAIDSTNAVAEKDETNNDALSATTFTVS